MEDSRIDRLEKELNELRAQMSVPKKEKKEKKVRAPSDYNIFMKKHIAELKAKHGDTYNHKLSFKSAAESWSKSKK